MSQKHLYFFLLCILLFGCSTSKKGTVAKFKKLSKPEKNWVLTHPFKAKKAMRISTSTITTTDSILKSGILDKELSGGKTDAFRHSFWMAELARQIGKRSAHKLGIAHEKGNQLDYEKHKFEEGQMPDSVSSAMDLNNNEIGIRIGLENKTLSQKELIKFLVDQINKGNLKIIAKNKQGNFVDCNGNILTEQELKGTWKNNKCLVNSDYQPK